LELTHTAVTPYCLRNKALYDWIQLLTPWLQQLPSPKRLPPAPLTLPRILRYSCTSAGINLVGTTVSIWLLYFYAPPPDADAIQYLPIAQVGILLTLSQVWGAVIDPFIGHWSDTSRSRWGRRQPFMLGAAPLALIFMVLLWTPLDGFPSDRNGLYFLAVTIAFFTSTSLIGIPYDSSLPELAATPAERVTLSMWKNIFGTVGVLLGALIAAPLYVNAGAKVMGLVVGSVSLLTVVCTVGVLPKTPPQPVKLSASQAMRATLKNPQFLRLAASTILVQTAYAMLLANLPYFVAVILQGNEADVSRLQGVVVIAMIATAPLWNWLGKRYRHRQLLLSTLLGLAIASLLAALVGSVAVPLWPHALFSLGLIGPFLGGYLVLVYAMMGAVVDYDAHLTQTRREATYYGAFALAAGVGPALAALLMPLLFERFGYTVAQPLGVQLVFAGAGLIALLGAAVFWGYQLGDTLAESLRNLGHD
jgi:GPH family glycoside/pentoside/hexuronide:cation symporter